MHKEYSKGEERPANCRVDESVSYFRLPQVLTLSLINAVTNSVSNLLTMPSLRAACATHLPDFLGHQYPKVSIITTAACLRDIHVVDYRARS